MPNAASLQAPTFPHFNENEYCPVKVITKQNLFEQCRKVFPTERKKKHSLNQDSKQKLKSTEKNPTKPIFKIKILNC